MGTSTPLAIRSPCWTAFFSQAPGVQAQLLGQLVDGALHGEGGLGWPGARYACTFGLLTTVAAVHQQVIDLVGPQAGQGAATHRRSRERPRFIGQVELGGGDAATAGRADFAAHQVADAGPALEHLLAGHGDFDRAATFLGEHRDHGVQVRGTLGASRRRPRSGMTLIWDSGMRKMAAVRERILKIPGCWSRWSHGHPAPERGGRVRLDVPLVHCLGGELPFTMTSASRNPCSSRR